MIDTTLGVTAFAVAVQLGATAEAWETVGEVEDVVSRPGADVLTVEEVGGASDRVAT
jgi:endonuclease/exonuclease/phosphatase family metal-dependent hydrolase